MFFFERQKNKIFTAVVFLLTSLFCVFVWLLFIDRPTIDNHQTYIGTKEGEQQLEIFWEQVIRKKGPREAYEILKNTYKDPLSKEGHIEAHIFGNALYTVSGVSGVSVCDDYLEFGCFHEFIGRAIVDKGLSVVTDINEVCNQLPGDDFLGCQHGIGHGTLGYIGYETEHLIEALEVCHGLIGVDRIGGCFGGALMEYNVRTMLYVDRVSFRELVAEEYYEPCDKAPVYAQEACYFWQPEWWKLIFPGFGPDAYEKMGELCSDLVGTNKKACFEGVGHSMSKITEDPLRAIELCTAATAQTSAEAKLQCLDTAASVLNLGKGKQVISQNASSSCTSLGEDATSYSICSLAF